jgi:drug/metabolite transporter (DMT)-like permease
LWEKFKVAIVFAVFVLFRAADRVFLYRVQKHLDNSGYNLILGNIIWPVSIQFMTVLMLLGYIVVMRQHGHREYTWRFFLPGNPAASSIGPVAMYQLALFSLGDQINAAMSAAPSSFISLPIQSLMTNFVIVWMLILASFWLGARYKQVHYIGCAMIILSVIVGVADKLEANDCSMTGGRVTNPERCLTAYKTASGDYKTLSVGSMVLWNVIFLLSTVPLAVSNVYKQKILQGVDLDVFYATWWSGIAQVFWGLLLFWVNWIPLPDQGAAQPSQTFRMIADTFQCMCGSTPEGGPASCEASGGTAMQWFVVYLFFNLSFNVLNLWLIKRISAVWAQIATTLCLCLTNIFSQWPLLVGKAAHLMTLSQWLATIMAAVALWTYNLESEALPASSGEKDKGPAASNDEMPCQFESFLQVAADTIPNSV